MKPEKIVLHLSFPHPVYGTFTPVKMEYHMFIDDTTEEHAALDHSKDALMSWFTKNYPALDQQPTETSISKTKEPEDRRIGVLVADIYSCESIKILETYKLMAKTKPELQAAYDQQYQKLIKSSSL